MRQHKILIQCQRCITMTPERMVELTHNLIDRVCLYESCSRANVKLSFLSGEHNRDFRYWKHALHGDGINFDRLAEWNDTRFELDYLITDNPKLGKKFKKYGGKVHLIL